MKKRKSIEKRLDFSGHFSIVAIITMVIIKVFCDELLPVRTEIEMNTRQFPKLMVEYTNAMSILRRKLKK